MTSWLRRSGLGPRSSCTARDRVTTAIAAGARAWAANRYRGRGRGLEVVALAGVEDDWSGGVTVRAWAPSRCASAVVAARTATAAECLPGLRLIRAVTASVVSNNDRDELAPPPYRCRWAWRLPRLAYTYARCSAVGCRLRADLDAREPGLCRRRSLPRRRKLLSRRVNSNSATSQPMRTRLEHAQATVESRDHPGRAAPLESFIQLEGDRIAVAYLRMQRLVRHLDRSTGRIRFPRVCACRSPANRTATRPSPV